MKKKFGFFLSLSNPDNDILQPIISDLQKKYCALPPFKPHLTIYHTTNLYSLPAAITATTRAVSQIKTFMIESDGLDHSETWSKILFIRIKPNPVISAIRTNIGIELGETESSVYTPHISLMYKDELSSIERGNIARNLRLPNHFRIQGIQIVSPGKSNNDWRDYAEWEVLHSITFPK